MTSFAHDGRFAHDEFVVRQRVKPLVNVYDVTTTDEQPVAYVNQKRFKLKEHIEIRASADDPTPELHLRAHKVFEARGRYDVTDAQGLAVGSMQKVFGRSFLRSTWRLLDPQGAEVAIARERSVPLALWRRFKGLVPYVGGLLELIPIPYAFEILAGEGYAGSAAPGTTIGEHVRRLGLRDHYDLRLLGDPERALDRRLAVTMAIGLDALQRR